MPAINQGFNVNVGDIVLLHQYVGTLEVCGFVKKYDPKKGKKGKVKLSMDYYNLSNSHPAYTTLLERVQGYLDSALDPERLRLEGPEKWFNLKHFTDYTVLADGERQAVEPRDLVLLVTPQGHGKICGYVLKNELNRIELCMPNPTNDSLAASIREWMSIGDNYPSETFSKKDLAFDKTLVLRKHR